MPTWLLYTIGVLIFAFGLLLSIALHEIGHMVPAKKFGVKVTQYMVGFGPTLFSRKRGDTEYGFKAIPLGGYIRMIGMVPPKADGRRSRWPRRIATSVEDFRRVSRAEVDPADSDREFYRLTPGKKMIIMLGGPVMNLFIFLVLTTILLTTIGTEHSDTTTTVGSVEKQVVCADPARAGKDLCPSTPIAAPAFGALLPGDRVLGVNGETITSWDQLVAAIEPSANVPLMLTVERDGTRRQVDITPVRNQKYVDATSTKTEAVGFLGVTSKTHDYFQVVSIAAVPGQIGSEISLGVDALGRYPQKVLSLYRTVFEGQQRDPAGAVGVVGIGRISGDLASSKAFNPREKFVALLGLLASVNLLLFFFNLLPLLPLDGGHVAGALFEAAKRGRQRLRARHEPELDAAGDVRTRPPIFVDTAQMLPIMYAVASVLIVVTLLTFYADIVKPIALPGG